MTSSRSDAAADGCLEQMPQEEGEERELRPPHPGRGVKLFGLRLQLASDDFVFPGLFEAFNRLLLVIILAFVLACTPSGQGQDVLLTVYLLSGIVLFSLNSLAAAMLSWHSAKGCVWDPQEALHRKRVVPILYSLVLLGLGEVCVLIFGSTVTGIKIYQSQLQGQEEERKEYVGILVLTLALWTFFIIKVMTLLITTKEFSDFLFAPGGGGDHRSECDEDEVAQKNEGCCYKFLSMLCFRQRTAQTKFAHDLRDAGKVFSELFQYDTFLASDIAAAFILIYSNRQPSSAAVSSRGSTPQRQTESAAKSAAFAAADGSRKVSEESRAPEPYAMRFGASETFVLDSGNDSEEVSYEGGRERSVVSREVAGHGGREREESAAVLLHYMKYAYVVYGSKLYVINHRFHLSNWWRMLRHLSCCSCCCCLPFYGRREFVQGDDCCLCELAVIRTTMPWLSEDDLVHLSYENTSAVSPFMVALDHKHRKVVVAIRGSGSLSDMVTDINAEPVSIAQAAGNLPGIPTDYKAHKGMVAAARHIYNRLLISDNLLNRAFLQCEEGDYEVVVTGHSLGAGIAVVLGFLLRACPSYRRAMVYAYGIVGANLNESAYLASKAFTRSVVVGDDVVTRLSLRSVQRLQDKMWAALVESRQPKYKILFQGVTAVLKSCLFPCCEKATSAIPSTNETATDIPSEEQLPSQRISEGRRVLVRQNSVGSNDTLLNNLDTLSSRTGMSASVAGAGCSAVSRSWPEMYPPGLIYHIRYPCGAEGGGQPTMVRVEDPRCFSEIDISPSMITDHFPQAYVDALRLLKREEDAQRNQSEMDF